MIYMMFLARLKSKIYFAISAGLFYRFDVYDVKVTSHGNFWCLILVNIDRKDQDLLHRYQIHHHRILIIENLRGFQVSTHFWFNSSFDSHKRQISARHQLVSALNDFIFLQEKKLYN